MDNIWKPIITFILGIGIGSGVTYALTKKKYEHIAEEEIESVREMYRTTKIEKEKRAEAALNKPDISQYGKILEKTGYKDYSTQSSVSVSISGDNPEKDKERLEPDESDKDFDYPLSDDLEEVSDEDSASDEKEMGKTQPIGPIHEITPDDYVRIDKYEQISLSYYTNNVFTDENENLLGNGIFDEVGPDFKKYIGHYASDCAYIQNEIKKTKYEIVRENYAYDDWPSGGVIGGDGDGDEDY